MKWWWWSLCSSSSYRIFNISNGKQKKLYKGSQGEDGTLIKVLHTLHPKSACCCRGNSPMYSLCLPVCSSGSDWPVRSLHCYLLFGQEHQCVWLLLWRVCGHHVRTLWSVELITFVDDREAITVFVCCDYWLLFVLYVFVFEWRHEYTVLCVCVCVCVCVSLSLRDRNRPEVQQWLQTSDHCLWGQVRLTL